MGSLHTNHTPLVPYITHIVASPNWLYLHDTDSCLLQAVGYCPLYRCRTTIFRKERGMNIEFTAWPKAFENFFGDILSERRHNQECLVRERTRVVGSGMQRRVKLESEVNHMISTARKVTRREGWWWAQCSRVESMVVQRAQDSCQILPTFVPSKGIPRTDGVEFQRVGWDADADGTMGLARVGPGLELMRFLGILENPWDSSWSPQTVMSNGHSEFVQAGQP
jgi:hypothetical protein